MYTLLIIDDEPIIVEGLVAYFQDVTHLELDIYYAYSAIEALQILKKSRVDIVLTDICMPRMNGLDLLKEIRLQWPRCKVIFLTGYNDFSYAQVALRNGGVDYLLKTEGNEEILKAVEKAANEISKESMNEQFILNAKQQFEAAIPLLQKEFFLELLQGEQFLLKELDKHFSDLEIPIKANLPVLLLVGQIDSWQEYMWTSNNVLLVFAVQNIVNDFLSPSVTLVSISIGKRRILWFIQPKDLIEKQIEIEHIDAIWKTIISFLKGSLDSIQDSCKGLLKTSLSFALSSSPSPWNQIEEKYIILQKLLSQGFGQKQEMILFEDNFPEYKKNRLTSVQEQKIRLHLKKIEMLKVFLENGQENEFTEVYYDLMNAIDDNKTINRSIVLEVYHSLVCILLAYINRWDVTVSIITKFDFDRMAYMDEHNSWKEITNYFMNIFQLIFKNKKNEREDRKHKLVDQLNKYIENNLNADLSLTSLSEKVHFNPQYLCRLYKQVTGTNIWDYIAEVRIAMAKELLDSGKLKIQEVATVVGYESSQYFTRFFKKVIGMTPQEYRDCRKIQ